MKKQQLFITLLLTMLAVQTTLADEIKVVGQNVQNFFYSLDRGRTQGNSVSMSNYNTEAGRTKKLNAIINALSVYTADIYAFNEVECCEEVMQLLADAMSSSTGKTYQPVADGLSYNKAEESDGVIKSGFIYNAATIEPVGNSVSTAIGYSHIYPNTMRMQTFRSKASGEVFSVSMNHFKASTSSDASYDTEQREGNSISLLKGLDQATQDPDILVLGDLNSVMGEQCLTNLVDAGYEEEILKRDPTAYTHYYDYTGSLIDHVFANPTMAAQITGAEVKYVANKHSVGSSKAYSDHDPYLVTLNLQAQPEVTYGYRKATAVQSGKTYLLVANNAKVANPVATSKTYEYLTATDVTPDGDAIALPSQKNAFKFEDDGSGKYYIKDYYGRYLYLYNNGSSYNYTTNAGNRSNGHTHSVTTQSDGTFLVQNTTAGYRLLFQNSNNNWSWRSWTSLYNGQYWPTLWEYDPTYVPTSITELPVYTQLTTTRKVVERGRLVIIAPNGSRYNMQGIELR